MKVNINDFKTNKAFIQDWYLKKGNGDISNAVSLMAASYLVPCIVCAFWIGEVSDWHPDSLAAITRLHKFYGYTKVLGVPSSYPGTEFNEIKG